MKKSRLWIFGDSFAYGSGVYDSLISLYPWGDSFTNYYWGNQLARYLNLQVENCGVAGSSLNSILFNVLNHLNKFKKEDYIIIGSTDGDRFELFSNDWFGPSSINPGMFFKYYSDKLKGLEHTNSCLSKFSEKEVDLLYSFCSDILEPHRRVKEQYFDSYVRELRVFLSQVGFYNVYFYDKTIWGFGEKITEWRKEYYNSDFEDGHWSPNGNTFIYKILKWSIKNNIREITYESIESNIAEIEKENGLPYIGKVVDTKDISYI